MSRLQAATSLARDCTARSIKKKTSSWPRPILAFSELLRNGAPSDAQKSNPNRVPCAGQLRDTIVHRGERVDDKTLARVRDLSERAELALVIGTSLTGAYAPILIWLYANQSARCACGVFGAQRFPNSCIAVA